MSATIGGLLVLATALLITTAAGAGGPPPDTPRGTGDPPASPTHWFPPPGPGAPRAVALVIHGLNLDPERMQPVVDALNAEGVDVLRLSLSGHGRNFAHREGMDAADARMEAFKTVSYARWSAETLAAWREARQRAESREIPLLLVGFSLGGLLGLDLLASRPEEPCARVILFAPAVSLHGWDHLIRVFSAFPRLVIPTLAPRHYLANPGTPMAAYNALFAALDHFEAHAGPRLNIPTLVFIDPEDELVSFAGLKRLADAAGLDRWRFHPVAKAETAAPGTLHHILIDPAAVGAEVWETIKGEMAAHLAPAALR
jgi:alpha-beta hydrolase superfamily lysophospholipase